MIKRFVILQDEALLLGELRRNEHRIPTLGAQGAQARAGSTPGQVAPDVAASPDDDSNTEADTEAGDHPIPDGTTLADVTREAMRRAERELICPTLRRVHWNRRKAAVLLGISYKTLLNKIKEHGLVQK